jgi:hypothetical protein
VLHLPKAVGPKVVRTTALHCTWPFCGKQTIHMPTLREIAVGSLSLSLPGAALSSPDTKKYDRGDVHPRNQIYVQGSRGRRQVHVKDASIVDVRKWCQRQCGRAMEKFCRRRPELAGASNQRIESRPDTCWLPYPICISIIQPSRLVWQPAASGPGRR